MTSARSWRADRAIGVVLALALLLLLIVVAPGRASAATTHRPVVTKVTPKKFHTEHRKVLTIRGKHFTRVKSVRVSGKKLATFTVVSKKKILAVVTKKTLKKAGVRKVVVRTKHGVSKVTAHSKVHVTVKPVPVAPAPGTTNTSTTVTTNGTETTYAGSGDDTITLALPDGAATAFVADVAFTSTLPTGGAFSVYEQSGAALTNPMIAGTYTSYTGSVLGDVATGRPTTALQIDADGSWTITIRSTTTSAGFVVSTSSTQSGNTVTTTTTSTLAGTGDGVYQYTGVAGSASIATSGSYLNIYRYAEPVTSESAGKAIVNRVGASTITKTWNVGPSVVQITSDGPWSITVTSTATTTSGTAASKKG